MQFTYCPECGSMDFVSIPNGFQCRKCHFLGPMSEGSMDKINEVRKRSPRPNRAPASPPSASPSVKELADRLKALKGKSTNEAEFL